MPPRKKLPKNVRRHGDGYRAVVERNSRRERSPTLPTIALAVQWRDAYLAAGDQPASAPLTLADGLELIMRDLEETGARPPTFTFYRNHARILFAHLGGAHVPVHSIATAHLRRYIDSRLAAGVAPQTIVGKELFVLRRILRLARRDGYVLLDNPFAALRTPRWRTGRFDVLSRQRIAEVVATMRADRRGRGAWHADIVELLFATGLRRAELCRLRVADVDLEQRRIAVDGKTGHRYQPIGDSLLPTLQRLIAQAQPDGRLIPSFRTVEKLCARWQAVEPKLSAHVLRHSYATAMADLVGPYELMSLMGHQSLQQTSRYFHGRGDAVRGALHRLLDPPDREHPATGDGPPPTT